MSNQKSNDLIISGVGSLSGGTFTNVSINGQAKINGDLNCSDFTIRGTGNVEGAVKTKRGKISGQIRVKSNLQSDEFKISGQANIGGNLEVKDARFSGVVSIKNSFTAGTVANTGIITVNGDCNSEVFISKGTFAIGGLLSAKNIDIYLHAPCKAKEIGGEKIRIHQDKIFSLRRLIKSIFPSLNINTGLYAETIEGDEVYLEYTKAKVVRENIVMIGKGCEIGLVEYHDRFEKSDKSAVIENKKIG
jgi:cytoskeletal protein CcmA (bactofilin family)